MRTNNTAIAPLAGFSYGHWPRLAALALAVVAIGRAGQCICLATPCCSIAAVLIFSGRLSLRPDAGWRPSQSWPPAALLAAGLIAPAAIEQGANVFLRIQPGNVFERQMPPNVYRFMKAQFDAAYPPSVRCKHGSQGCWQDEATESTTFMPSPPTVRGPHPGLFSRGDGYRLFRPSCCGSGSSTTSAIIGTPPPPTLTWLTASHSGWGWRAGAPPCPGS